MNQRQCIILQGSKDWCRMASETLLVDYELGQTLWLSNHAPEKAISTSQKKAQSQLGKEFDAVIFDALDEFNLDSFGIIVGIIKQGGVIILWLESNYKTSLTMQRFMRIIAEFEQKYDYFTIVQQGQDLPRRNQWGQTRLIYEEQPEVEVGLKSIESDPIDSILTSDQQQAVEAIMKVVHGHRRRPLVLSADRGRGKSASLGIAAAQLLKEGKQTVLVTAPSLATVDTVFEHASRLLADAATSTGLISLNGAEIRFVAPDMLIESDLKADLVLVDEAAAIPASMLEKLLQQYSRIVFSTTLHGYEGTGRGFAVHFQKILDQKTPNWHHYRMETPIRWSVDDSLEAFSFESLLLNAVPVADDLIKDVQLEQCHFECIDRHALIHNEQDLRELFGLMVLAHYRTRPSDLQMMLDRDDVSVYVVRYQGHIVASAWLVKEGGLDDELSANIHAGHRRLKGHLLPQSLLAHAGMIDAGGLSYQRVIRIATHPAIQQRGIAKTLLNNINTQIECDILGASFSASQDVINFWSQSAYSAVRLGIHKDDVSGCHSIMMLKAKSSAGQKLLDESIERFQRHWPHLVLNQFKYIDTALVVQLSQQLPTSNTQLTKWDKQEIHAFTTGQRAYEFSQVALWTYVSSIIRTTEFLLLSTQQQQLCVMVILQQQAWTDVLKQCKYTGKSQAVMALREAIALLWNCS